jgi:hypothetical protein
MLNVASIAAYEQLMNMRISIPKLVALIGFDDFPPASCASSNKAYPLIFGTQDPVSYEIIRSANSTKLQRDRLVGSQ